MSVALVVPWRDSPGRGYAQKLVLDWYDENFPGIDVILADSGTEEFHRSGSRNHGVRLASNYDVVVLNDADTLPESAPLLAAIEMCVSTGLVHLPYTQYRSLGVTGTQEYLRGLSLRDCPSTLVKGACSGVYVTTPETWWSHGGQDEEFRGWGFEDPAWEMAHKTLLGHPPVRHKGNVYALHHDSSVKQGEQYKENARRCYLYQMAQGNYEEMHALVFGDDS